MRKTERLDEILVRLGYATPAQVDEAVQRQRDQGGRFGTNLIRLGHVTEKQLFDALVEQFRVPTISVSEETIPAELLEKMPEGLAAERLILPVSWNPSQRVLGLAVANPSDEEAISAVAVAFGARRVRVSIAPESVLADLASRLAGRSSGGGVRLVALPELFEPEQHDAAPRVDLTDVERRILLVTRRAAHKNFLPPVFRAEGVGLLAASTSEEAAEVLADSDVESVLVDSAMREELDAWRRSGRVPGLPQRADVIHSVAETLASTPVPYATVARSLRATAQALAELRCAAVGATPPYSLMANDLDATAERLELGAVAKDGLNLAMYALTPVPEPGKSIDPFRTFEGSLELVERIRFPWPIASVLSACHRLFIGELDLEGLSDEDPEVAVGAQLLALVWFRHNLVPTEEVADDPATTVRTSLRQFAGRLATLEIVESYLDEIADRGALGASHGDNRVLLVGEERITRALPPALTRVGCEVLVAEEVAGAQNIIEGLGPAGIVMDHAVFGSELELFVRVLRLDGDARLFVLTDVNDPSLVLNLLDIGVDDVFPPPHDFDVIAARVSRAIHVRGDPSAAVAEKGQFSAAFDAFSFIDLAQMLSNGLKTVRVDLAGGDGERAILHLVNGTPIYAECGGLTGASAVYRVISWEDRGEFTVHETDDVPGQNLVESMQSLLMEGVRLLDEARAS